MDVLEHATDTLSALVRSGFGPCGDETLLFAPPDAPVVSADGRALLASWRRGLRENSVTADATSSVPMQTFILSAAESLGLLIGDGMSAFVLLLDSAVKRARDAIRGAQSQWSSDTSAQQLAAAVGNVKRECALLLSDCDAWRPGLRIATPIVFERGSDSEALTPSDEFYAAAVCILQSGLAGCLGDRALAFIIELVLRWLFTPPLAPQHDRHSCRSSKHCDGSSCIDAALLLARVQQYIARASDMVAFAVAPSVFRSLVLPPDEFILRKSVVPSQQASVSSLLSIGASQAPVRFVCLTSALSLATDGANHVTLSVPTDTARFAAAAAPLAFATSFLAALRSAHRVQLLITTEAVDDAVVAICSRLGIACVQLAERTDVFDLCAVARVYPLASVLDAVDPLAHVGVSVRGISSVRLEQSPGLWFHGLDTHRDSGSTSAKRSAGNGVVPQLVLKAPTRGVYKQYARAVVKALRILQSWWEPLCSTSSDSGTRAPQLELFSCRGGGATELALAQELDAAHALSAASGASVSAAQQLARHIVAQALRDVVVALYSNMSSSLGLSQSTPEPCGVGRASTGTSRQAMRTVLQDLAQLAVSHDASALPARPIYGYVLERNHAVATRLGPISVPTLRYSDPHSLGLAHPWRRIETLVALTLETLEQLLRVDSVLCATANLRSKDSDSDSDSEIGS